MYSLNSTLAIGGFALTFGAVDQYHYGILGILLALVLAPIALTLPWGVAAGIVGLGEERTALISKAAGTLFAAWSVALVSLVPFFVVLEGMAFVPGGRLSSAFTWALLPVAIGGVGVLLFVTWRQSRVLTQAFLQRGDGPDGPPNS